MPSAMIQGAPAYYWERDYDRITQALMGLNQMLDQKEKERERRMARDLAMLQNDPRQAAGPAGKQFMETYADDPQAVAFVQSLAAQGQSQMNLEAGQSSYFEGLYQAQQEQGRRAAEFMGVGQDLQDAADLLSEADAWAGAPQDPTLTREARLAAEIGDRQRFAQNQEDPRWTAYSSLPLEQRAEVGPWLWQKGQMPMPSILGVGMPALDPKVVLANQMGLPPEDQYNAFLQAAGLAASPGAQLQKTMQDDAQAFRAEQDRLEYERRLEAMRKQHELDLALRREPPGKSPGTTGGGATGKGVDEAVRSLVSPDAMKRASAPSTGSAKGPDGKPVKINIPTYSTGTAAEVGKILGSTSDDGAYMAQVAISEWRKINERLATDPAIAERAKSLGHTAEDLWKMWAQKFVTGATGP